jgi:hypothetical protein
MLSGQLRESKKQRIGLAAAAILACSATTIAIAATEPWEQVLSQQLASEQMCDMSGTYNVKEFPLGDDVVMIGKARCLDGREFDFSQQKNHMKFEIKQCEPTVC